MILELIISHGLLDVSVERHVCRCLGAGIIPDREYGVRSNELEDTGKVALVRLSKMVSVAWVSFSVAMLLIP